MGTEFDLEVVDDSLLQDEEYYENDEDFIKFQQIIKDIELKNMFKKMYSSIDNFPRNIKKNLYINTAISVAIIVLLFFILFKLKYFSWLLLIASLSLFAFLTIRNISTIIYFKHASFVTFTGRIIESYPIGSKFTNNLRFVIKIEDNDGSTLSFEYFDKRQLNFDQLITVFLRENTPISASDYGPFVGSYIEIVPTDEIISRKNMLELKETLDSKNITIEDYLSNKSTF